ncbi:MAG: MipA/OmpV family protein [Proteobacteria bacterium]|nr:MipA/OmpV family protein [Pseudomonadota bacterium]
MTRPACLFGSVAAAGAVVLAASAAQAQAASSGFTIFGWAVSGSLSAQVTPDYLGAKTYSLGPSGSLDVYRPGTLSSFGAPDDSPGLQLLGDRTLAAGAVVRLRSGRDDSDVLRGIHKVGFAIEPGVYAEWWPAAGVRLHGELRHGAMGDSAWSGDVALDLVHDEARWLLSIGPRVHLGDSRFTRTYFGITAADALRSPNHVAAYGADGAFVSWGGLASAEYRWSPRWSLLANADYQRLTGDAADSPIVARLGSPDQFTASLGLRYRFGG